jgi:hypothetical protein
MCGRHGLARPPREVAPAQRRPMRMLQRLDPLVLVDLPIDVVVVLEHQERTGEAEGIERPLGKR